MRLDGAMAARRIPDPKAGGSNPSQVTPCDPGVAQLVEQWTVKRVAQRSIGRQFKSASPDVVLQFFFLWVGVATPKRRAGAPRARRPPVIRSYHGEDTGSHQNSEVKRR